MKTEKDKRMLIREKGGMPFGQKPMTRRRPVYVASLCCGAHIHGAHAPSTGSQIFLLLYPPNRRTHTNTR